ncbi:uncharacterized protein LOC126371620 [Pectinophora gossypiella]|uniref:uncharacterized protein LOC126371620 n=1 Tax=Pectinophora gossypiella TaxID=13191 RepID=UPI00214E550C|nr:uncharacterized protein LOC126371620 [Pectinophora gossypiella]
MIKIGTIYEDVTTDVLGDIGNWQWLVTLVTTVLMTSNFFTHFEDIFLLRSSDVFCLPSRLFTNVGNITLCTYTLDNGTNFICDEWNVKLLWTIWYNKSWLIFCDNKMKLSLTAVVYRLAMVFGFVTFGLVADR